MKLSMVGRPNRRNSRLACRCGGYHFPHRKTGGACDAGPRRDYYLALRHGCDEATAKSYLPADVLERMERWIAQGGIAGKARNMEEDTRLAAVA